MIWDALQEQASSCIKKEAFLKSFIEDNVLNHSSLEESLAFILSDKLANNIAKESYQEKILEVFSSCDLLLDEVKKDLESIVTKDASKPNYLTVLLYYKGFHAIQISRIAHRFWQNSCPMMAYHLQSRNAEIFTVDIHPNAKIGHGLFLDHATSFVVGETAIIGNNVSILHEVTLGGSGKACGDRHPKVGDDVLIGAGAKLLGDIRIGKGAKIGAGSVVLDDIADHCTAVGVPAKVIGLEDNPRPSDSMDHYISL